MRTPAKWGGVALGGVAETRLMGYRKCRSLYHRPRRLLRAACPSTRGSCRRRLRLCRAALGLVAAAALLAGRTATALVWAL